MSALCSASTLLCLILTLDAQTTNEPNTTDIFNTTGDTNITYNFTESYTTVEPTQSPGAPEEPSLPTEPLPESGRLPIADSPVGRLCPCDTHRDVCDINCCCDPECISQEVSLFTSCSVLTVSSSTRLCSRDVALYTLRNAADGRSELQTSVSVETDYDLLCIRSQNRHDSFSHPAPVTPTDRNFEGLFEQFTSFVFGSDEAELVSLTELQTSSGYQYGDVVLTAAQGEHRGVMLLPASGLTAQCVDSPAAFLVDQHSLCSQHVILDRDCTSSPALSMDTFTDIQLLSGRNAGAAVVPVTVDSVTLQSVSGTQTELRAGSGGTLTPAVMRPGLCANVVLKVFYVMEYSSTGDIVNATVSVLLGFIQKTSLLLQQEFHITYVQEDGGELAIHFSGNPGYVSGLPLESATRTAQGLSRSVGHFLSVFHSEAHQDCLQGPHQRSLVLFGLNSQSGCTLRLTDTFNCSLLSELLLSVLRGSDPAQYVALFGNSLLDNPTDWLQIKRVSRGEAAGCSVPLSLHLEIEWTKYGALSNPQAQIVSIKEIIQTNSSSLDRLSGGSGVLPISSSVAFIPVSAPARPGYRATPTINARLPFDFFFPFV
ncbi:tectonic-1-like isoform X1 [Gouania willdenowi]|uniref:Tectonic-1 n=1 Tax=Gouania willdenowi TaxID=441366 RepID=A0A8C5GPZ3_GOUWI|nr:tectonic-1 isoform X1 [Gouania willdenowi]